MEQLLYERRGSKARARRRVPWTQQASNSGMGRQLRWLCGPTGASSDWWEITVGLPRGFEPCACSVYKEGYRAWGTVGSWETRDSA